MENNQPMDTEEDPVIEMPPPRGRGRPKNPNRHRPDGTYDRKPLDHHYHRNYYKKHKKISICPMCHKEMMENYVRVHMTTRGGIRKAFAETNELWNSLPDDIIPRNVDMMNYVEFAIWYCRNVLPWVHEVRMRENAENNNLD